MSAEVARILREAAELVERGWTKGAFARRRDGAATYAEDPDATCWCTSGAIERCAGTVEAAAEASWYLRTWVRTGVVSAWNDAQPGPEPVIAALRAAAEEAEQA